MELGLRIPHGFPQVKPVVICAAGAEYLPSHLIQNNRLTLRWLQGGWPSKYTLKDFVQDFLASFQKPVVQSTFDCPACNAMFPKESSLNEHYLSTHVQETLTIKSYRNKECRRILVSPQSSFRELQSRLKQIHGENNAFNIHYEDKDGDRCSIGSDDELLAAFHSARPARELKLTLSVVAPDFLTQPGVPVVPVLAKVAAKPVGHEIKMKEISFGKEIGTGSSCKVYWGTWRGGPVAVKILTVIDEAGKQHEFDQEAGMMRRLGSHPSIVLLLGVCRNPLSLIFEYVPYTILYVTRSHLVLPNIILPVVNSSYAPKKRRCHRLLMTGARDYK